MATREKIGDLYCILNWKEITRRYFSIPQPHFCNKMNGVSINNGKPKSFTKDELDTLQSALKDIAVKIYAAAERLNE